MLKLYLPLVLLFAVALPSDAFASLGSSGLPTDTGFQTIYNFLTGEFAFLTSVAGVVVGTATLLFGGDMNGVVRFAILMVILVCFLLGAPGLISVLTGKGAIIA